MVETILSVFISAIALHYVALCGASPIRQSRPLPSEITGIAKISIGSKYVYRAGTRLKSQQLTRSEVVLPEFIWEFIRFRETLPGDETDSNLCIGNYAAKCLIFRYYNADEQMLYYLRRERDSSGNLKKKIAVGPYVEGDSITDYVFALRFDERSSQTILLSASEPNKIIKTAGRSGMLCTTDDSNSYSISFANYEPL